LKETLLWRAIFRQDPEGVQGQRKRLSTDNDVVDGDVDELHKEPNEAHDKEPSRHGSCNFQEFFACPRIAALASHTYITPL
jgi:hypothetical protein